MRCWVRVGKLTVARRRQAGLLTKYLPDTSVGSGKPGFCSKSGSSVAFVGAECGWRTEQREGQTQAWCPGWPGWGGLCPVPQVVPPPRACVWVSVPENAESKPLGLSGELVDTACNVCQAFLGQLEHEDIDIFKDAAQDLTEDEWKDLTRQYYSLVE